MLLFFSSFFGFASSNEHPISWEAMAIRQREEELFYSIKADVQWNEKKLEEIKHLIHHPLFNVNRLYHTGNITETLLHRAIKTKQFELALCLLEKGANPELQDKLGNTILHYYCMHSLSMMETEKAIEIFKQLLEKIDNSTLALSNCSGETVLHVLLKTFIEQKVYKKELFSEVLKLLKKFHVPFDYQDEEGNRLLHYLASIDEKCIGFNNDSVLQITQQLLDYCQPHVKNNYGFSAAEFATLRGDKALAAVLAKDKSIAVHRWYEEKSAFISNFVDSGQWSRSQREHIQWFLETNADLSFPKLWEKEAKIQADKAWCEHIQSKLNNTPAYKEVLLALLVWYGESKPSLKQTILANPHRTLFSMIEHKVSPLFIRLLLERGWNEGLHSQDDKGNTILHHVISVLQDHLQTLNHNGSAIEEENKPVINQNWFWIEYKHICGVLELLLQHGLDPNQQNAEGETPLHQLAAMQNVTYNIYFTRCQSYIASILRENGTNLELKTKNGKTALAIAELISSRAVLKLQDIDNQELDVIAKLIQDLSIIDTLKGKNYISYLPIELLNNIFSHLPLKVLAKASKTSHQFNNIIQGFHFWIKYLRPHYKTLMEAYIERLRKEYQDEFYANQKATHYLKQIIKEAPYIIRSEYLELIFQETYQSLQRLKYEGKYRTDIRSSSGLWFSNGLPDLILNDRSGVNFAIIFSEITLIEDVTLRKCMQPIISLSYHTPEEYFIRNRNIVLLILSLPDLWNRFMEECRQESNINRTLTQVVLAVAKRIVGDKMIVLDEEVALTFLRHVEFRKLLLEDNPDTLQWLLYIFQKSIEYSDYPARRGGEPITYKLVGASRLSTALFILEDKDYREKLEKGLWATQDKLEALARELCNILENSHRSDLKVRTTANSILEKLKHLAQERGRTVMPTSFRRL
jgi:ankyrin repeat protein